MEIPPRGDYVDYSGDPLIMHLIECVRLLDERVGVAIERAIAAERAGQWQTINPDPRTDEDRFGQDHH